MHWRASVSPSGFRLSLSTTIKMPISAAFAYTSATGFGIQDIHMKEMDERITQRTAEEQKRLAELEEEEEQRRSRRETYYGKDANTKYQRLRRRHIYIFNPEDLDNADLISMVENSPTYQRDKSTLAAIKLKAEEAGILATEEAREAENSGNGIITF